MRKFFISMGVCLVGFLGSSQAEESSFVARDFTSLLEMPGWNRDLLLMHFKLYQGYVKNSNLVFEEISQLNQKGLSRSYEFGSLKRRFGWEFDGMRLHELYFENLTSSPAPLKENSLLEQIKQDFGSLDLWKQDFISTGMIRGIGWVILYKDKLTGRLYNTWINEHDLGHLVLGDPLLVMDVFEHAYITQFALDKEKYIDLFFQSLNWQAVNERWMTSKLTNPK